MPADFNRAVKAGGKVVTKTLSKGRYIHLVKDKSGHWHAGEVRTKKGQ